MQSSSSTAAAKRGGNTYPVPPYLRIMLASNRRETLLAKMFAGERAWTHKEVYAVRFATLVLGSSWRYRSEGWLRKISISSTYQIDSYHRPFHAELLEAKIYIYPTSRLLFILIVLAREDKSTAVAAP